MDATKKYELTINKFGGRLKLAHYRIAEAVKLPSHDLSFITVYDPRDKGYYYIDARETEQTNKVKLGRLDYNNGDVELTQCKEISCSELLKDIPESFIEPMRVERDNTEMFAYLNDSSNFKSFVKDKIGLLPCRYGLKKKRNGEITTRYYLFSIAYQN